MRQPSEPGTAETRCGWRTPALADCAALIRGQDGSKLRLEIIDADCKPNMVELTRHKVDR